LTGWVRQKGPTVIGICCCGDPALVGKAKNKINKISKRTNNPRTLAEPSAPAMPQSRTIKETFKCRKISICAIDENGQLTTTATSQ
jgi:hypothetical protein